MGGEIEASTLVAAPPSAPQGRPNRWSALLRRFAATPSERCGGLEFAALVYLSVPLVIFFWSFIRIDMAAPALTAILAVLYRVRPRGPDRAWPGLNQAFLCAAISGLFLWACAYLPPFGHTWDWLKHFGVVNELAQHTWPPINEESGTFLRYSLGYHLVPGLITKIFGNRLIELWMFVHTWVGLFLVLALLLKQAKPFCPATFLLLFLLFSGLDLIGWLLLGRASSILAHNEWWANYAFAYEGHATLFLWVPHHALAGMLGVLLLPTGQPNSMSPQGLSLLGAAVLLWSPFAALGLAPFALAWAVRHGREAFVDLGNILCGLVLGTPLLAYLLSGTSRLPQGFNWDHEGFSIGSLVNFLLLEVGLYLLALWLYGWHHLRYPAIVIAVLLLLPLYRIGIHNDFTMRACIPALTLLAMAAAASLAEPRTGWRWIPLATLMLVGSATSILEIVGRGLEGYVPAREQSMRSGTFSQEPYVGQFNAPLPNWVLRRTAD
jgi:hypothetical protein